jgi:signal transduction histidine kinase
VFKKSQSKEPFLSKLSHQVPYKEKNLWFYFAASNFIISMLVGFAMGLIYLFLLTFDLIPKGFGRGTPLIMLLLTSGLIAAFVTTFIGRIILTPLQHFIHATQVVAKGDFTIQLENKSKLRTLQNMTSNFNTMVNDLASIETLRSDFINNVSHEFKTPLTAIEGYAMLLQSENITQDDFNQYVTMIIESTGQLSTITTNILWLSKLEQEDILQKQSTFLLDEQLRQSILQLEPFWHEKKLELDIEIETASYTGAENLLFQVWSNLLSNAIKFSHIGGALRVTLTTKNNQILVSIEDKGMGMSELTQKHIFDKFYQGETSRSQEGSGLGLPLVKSILKLHDGTIDYESELDKGTTVTVALPVTTF